MPKKILPRWKKQCLCLTADEFTEICTELYGPGTRVHYDMDGLWIDREDNTESGFGPDVSDDDLNRDLSKYFSIEVTSVHIDDADYVCAWIVYKEAAA